MSTDRADERDAIAGAMQSLSLPPDPQIAARLVAYVDLLERWSAVYNLTAIRDRSAMRVQHLNDSLAIAAALLRGVSARTPRILDVGSGAGLPGVVVAACWPESQVTCLDAVGKKAAFVAQAASTLGLSNLRSVHARAETHRPDAPYDVVTARAFATLTNAVAATRHAVHADGVWALAKGRSPDDERQALAPDLTVFHVERLSVPDLGAERHLVWIRRSALAQTP